MIGYDGLRLNNVQFYWRASYFLHKKDGVWTWVRFHSIDYPDTPEAERARDHMRMDEADAIGIRLVFMDAKGNLIRTGCTAPFEGDDWITYRPYLGYVMPENGKLVRLFASVPRQRDKGLVFDGNARNVNVGGRLGKVTISVTGLMSALCDRMNHGYADEDEFIQAVRDGHATIIEAELALYDGALWYHGDKLATVKYKDGKVLVTYLESLERSIHAHLFDEWQNVIAQEKS